MAQVFGKGVNRCLKGFAVFVAEFVVGFKAVFGFVFGKDVGYLFEVGIDFFEQGFVFLGNHRTEEFDDFLRAFDVGLEVAQVGVAVTVFFAADFAAGNFFNQHCRAADDFVRREGEGVDFFLQGFNVFHEFVGNVFHAGYVFFDPQGVFDAVEAGEGCVFGFVFEVVFTRVDGGVEFVEEFGNRLDAFVVGAGGGKQGFGFFDVARFDGVGEGFGFGNQFFGFALNVHFIVGKRFGEFFQIGFVARVFKAAVGYHQLAARVGQEAAGHFVFARQQGNGHFVGKSGGDVFALVDHHYAFEDFPFELAAAVVFDVEHDLSARYGQFHRFAGSVVHADVDGAVGIRA